MIGFTKLLAASALAFAVVSPAFAAGEETTLEERNVYLFMNGKMISAKATDATHAMAMKEFKPLANGTMIYRSGGKFYIATDRKMGNGKMLSTEMFGRDLGIGSQS